ncbi:hypothetical protein CIW48_22740 [Methylobacterium sp. P1-11]|uniref:hypothetical protein n=1 Tax=Methylobacterium sp. P1-11 TaxID=2024616 RepID=UPI0011EBC68A|nr:hypothetical protein [Methylobacterium sp. P1-11]KAA0121617.1 hypothetical protein CIW48_22740 [Methylobacterium sp. P1-11]
MTKRIALFGAALALPLVLSALPAMASGPCDDKDALLSHVYPKASRSGDGFDLKGSYVQHVSSASVACKVWPADPSLTLVAVPLIEAAPDTAGDIRGDVEILVLDSASGRPLARRIEMAMAFSDAIQFDGVTLDTARYDIRPGTRAFGLRTAQSGSSRVNPFSEEALWLYGFEGGRITRVLDGLVVGRVTGENDGNCTGTTTAIRRTVSVGPEARGGYRDLVVDQTEARESSSKAAGDRCRSAKAPGPGAQEVIRFGSVRYDPPAGLQPKPDGTGGGWFSLVAVEAAGTRLASPAPASSTGTPRPSFACAKATTKVERAICASAPLAKADSEVATLYRERRAALPPAAAVLLAQDETYFLTSRERVYGYGETDPDDLLLAVIRGRADFLRSLRTPPGDGLEGNWGNLFAKMTVARFGRPVSSRRQRKRACHGALGLRCPRHGASRRRRPRGEGRGGRVRAPAAPGRADAQGGGSTPARQTRLDARLLRPERLARGRLLHDAGIAAVMDPSVSGMQGKDGCAILF